MAQLGQFLSGEVLVADTIMPDWCSGDGAEGRQLDDRPPQCLALQLPVYAEGFALECAAMKRMRETIGLMNVELTPPFCRRVQEAERVL